VFFYLNYATKELNVANQDVLETMI